MGISIVNNGGTNSITINNSNDIVIKNKGEENISVNSSKNIDVNINKNSMDGYHIIVIIFFSFLFIITAVFFYNLLKQSKSEGVIDWMDSSDISHEIEEENLFEKRKKELFFLINEKFHSDQLISRIENNILNLEDKYSKNLLRLKSVEFKKDYVVQINKENEEIISLMEKFINEINIQKNNFEEAEDLEKILSIFKN